MDFAFEYWAPTKHKYETDPLHIIRIPIQAYVSYEFQVDAGPLEAVGSYFSAGLGLNVLTGEYVDEMDTKYRFKPSFRWGLGGSIAFSGNWAVKVGFGGDAGTTEDMVYDWNWNNNSFFMVEAAYRF